MKSKTNATKSIKIVASVLLFAVMLSACSSSSESSNDKDIDLAAASTNPNSTGVSSAAKLIAQGIIDADGDRVFAQISSSCQSKLSRIEVTNQLKTVRAYLVSFLGASPDEFSVSKVETTNVVKGQTGQARYTIRVVGKSREALAKALETTAPPVTNQTTQSSLPSFSFDEPTDWFDFVYESNTWKLESCEEFLASAGVINNTVTASSPDK